MSHYLRERPNCTETIGKNLNKCPHCGHIVEVFPVPDTGGEKLREIFQWESTGCRLQTVWMGGVALWFGTTVVGHIVVGSIGWVMGWDGSINSTLSSCIMCIAPVIGLLGGIALYRKLMGLD